MSPPRPLDAAWIDLVERLAPRVLGRQDRTGPALAAAITQASALYTRERHRMDEVGLAPRLRFFFLRDLPKIEGPLAELAARGALPAGERWRILDVGAGLGTTSLGAAAYAKRLGVLRVEVRALEQDAASLDVMTQLAREATKAGLTPEVAVTGQAVDLERLDASQLGPVDLIVVGLALNELFLDRDEGARLDAQEALLRALTRRLAPGGSLIVIEPALRHGTRDLMTLRDRFAAAGDGVGVFAPCLRDGPCPLLRRERDWCHAELDLAFPPRLAELAKASGLRYERLTYATLTLRRDAARLGDGDPRTWRVVGGPIESKGKREWDLCGPAGLVRLRRMDRERDAGNAWLDGARRGTRVRLTEELSDGASLRAGPGVEVKEAP